MARFFNPEKGIWPIFGFVGDVVLLSLLWTVFSAPLVTAGASSAALYDTAVSCFRRKEQDYLRRFFSTFKREFKNALLPTLLWALILGGFYMLFRRLAAGFEGGAGLAAASVLSALLLLPLGVCCWVFPLLSRFTLGFAQLNGNALRLALGHILSTFAMALGCALSLWLTLRMAFLPLFFLPCLLALWCALFMEPVFRQYEHPQEPDGQA